MRRVIPGVYRDGETVHFDIPELLKENGYADTPENRNTMTEAVQEVCRQLYPATRQIVVTHDN